MKRARPDGVSVTLMSDIAERKGLSHVSKSHMFDLKKSYMAKVGPARPGDEARIVDWAIAEKRKTGRSPSLPKAGKPNAKSSAAAPLLAAAVTVLRNMGIQSVSFFEP